MKILYLTPHLSTGGLPQYLLKKIQLLNEECTIFLVEYSDITGGHLVVQRSQIEKILGDRFFSLGDPDRSVTEKAQEFKELLFVIDPDVVHLEEIPEISDLIHLADLVYKDDRKYKVFETSHDSSFDTKLKKFFPDKFLFVSQWQIDQYKSLGIPSELVEYPIEYRERNYLGSRYKLNFDPYKKHIIHVGLWTSRKNQAELLDIARAMQDYPVQFHFVGNQAENFDWYWKPLMQNLPPNVKVWGERKDVDNFYQAADLMVFTSRGNDNDKETMPLVIREAIGWKLPTLIYNLPVYQNYFDKFDTIHYLNEDGSNIQLICSHLGMEYKGEKTKYFNYHFDENENKLHFSHLRKVGNYLIAVKDIDSKACIWSVRTGVIHQGHSLWVQPKPKHVIDFKNSELFGGFLIQVFSGDNLVQEERMRFRNCAVFKPEADFSNDQPIWDNYNEFFVERIYDRYLGYGYEVVFDIGASIGLFSHYMKTRGAKLIHAYEPNLAALYQLRNNYESDASVVVHDRAVASKEGKLWFYTNDDNSLISALHSGIDRGKKSYKVEAVTLDQALAGYEQVDLVKIDIEGAEFEIICNCPVEVFMKVKAFLIEYHDFYFDDGEQRVINMIATLEGAGYKVERPSEVKYIYASKKPI